MALTVTALTSGTDAGTTTTYTTASVTINTGELCLLSVQGATNAPTGVAGTGLTFTNVQAGTWDSTRKVDYWRAMPTVDFTGTITITYSSGPGQCEWSVYKILGADTGGVNGADAIVQAPAIATGTGTTGSKVLAALSSANNMAVGAIVHANANLSTPDSDFVEIHDVTVESRSLQTLYKINDTTPSGTWTTSAAWGALAIEIKAAAAGGIAVPIITRQFRARWQ